ncbi:hypothetical protein SAMN06265365_1354 [Tistlia consotensis]|uniref:ATPase n=1 Tax=Tistlia consotensis USBA 355 TaxID=560819 RepID=A0A1Y6CUW1_9PROT|nr:BCAM0308 family protein [Tistlia consotensis]SMF79848.1 hypothetical protein SAMN05428998_14047 [Tistlia consotensis USBA 355]SNS16346.1 hypothetical protein SAMN06265365_1354 [Tistlia consotensis]
MTASRQQGAQPAGRRIAGHAQDDHIADPYQRQRKLHEPTACPDCGAIFHQGRWQWGDTPEGAESEACPACRRIADDLPAGIVTLAGAYVAGHRDEILGLARRQEELEKPEHPLNRIMRVKEEAGAIEIATTDIHLPRRIGEALHHAFGGELALDYEPDGYFLRARWSRD